MDIVPHIFTAKVMHKRFFPKVNQFTYSVYYLAVPLSQIAQLADGWRFGVNRFGILSFYDKDHGHKDGSAPEQWARDILGDYGLNETTQDIVLVTMPRVLGYVFNPVSFWLCLDENQQVRAVICQVNNTFGETHSYLCAHADHRVITENDWLEAEKLFHVSPFLEREGYYRFRFACQSDKIGVWIDFLDGQGEKKLITSLTGALSSYNRKTRRKAFWQHPLVTLKTIFLIHWQAIKIVAKRIPYISKPEQQEVRLSTTRNVTKL